MIENPDKLSDDVVEAWFYAHRGQLVEIPDDAYFANPGGLGRMGAGRPSDARKKKLYCTRLYRPRSGGKGFARLTGVLHIVFTEKASYLSGDYCRWQGMADEPLVQPSSNKDYPHTCPKCGAPAYIGFFKIDCLKGCL